MLEVARHRPLVVLLVTAAVAHPAAAQAPPSAVDLPAVTIEQFLPVESRNLTVGPFEAERRPTGVSQPFFLVGCDADSIAWVQENRERLIALRAFGLVIDAPDGEAYRRLKSAAEGLVVRPVAGALLAEHLGLRHYPALVTADGIFP